MNVFDLFKKEKLHFKDTIMLFFTSVLFDEKDEKTFHMFLNSCLKDKQGFSCYKVTFTTNNNNKLFIDNTLETLTFIRLRDLINNYYVSNNIYLKKYARVNFNSCLFVQVDKRQDTTYYHLYIFSNKLIKDIETILNLTNFKYKFNFTKKERKLIFRLKNNYLKGFKYSYNFYYMQDIQDNIKTLEKDIKEKERDLIYFNDTFNLNKEVFFKKLQDEYIETLETLESLERQLKDLKELESDLISSKDKKSTLNDYLQDNLLY